MQEYDKSSKWLIQHHGDSSQNQPDERPESRPGLTGERLVVIIPISIADGDDRWMSEQRVEGVAPLCRWLN
jgi:hypothetical protein